MRTPRRSPEEESVDDEVEADWSPSRYEWTAEAMADFLSNLLSRRRVQPGRHPGRHRRSGGRRTVAGTAPTKENQTYRSNGQIEPGDADGDREGGPASRMETR